MQPNTFISDKYVHLIGFVKNTHLILDHAKVSNKSTEYFMSNDRCVM